MPFAHSMILKLEDFLQLESTHPKTKTDCLQVANPFAEMGQMVEDGVGTRFGPESFVDGACDCADTLLRLIEKAQSFADIGCDSRLVCADVCHCHARSLDACCSGIPPDG